MLSHMTYTCLSATDFTPTGAHVAIEPILRRHPNMRSKPFEIIKHVNPYVVTGMLG